MNERLKQLAEQAGFTEGGYESDEGPWIGPEFNKEKFAELIVRECVAQAEEESSWPYSSFGKKIKQHFGVKE